MTSLATGSLCYGERPWRRAPDDAGGEGDIYRASAHERAQVVQAALDAGITFFHAAHEREAVSLGQSIQTLDARERMVISTTDGDALSRCPDTEAGAYEAVGRAIARKQELLGVERLDVFHLYDVRAEVHTRARLAGAMQALNAARAQGHLARFGATCYEDYDHLARAIEQQQYLPDCVVTRFNFMDQRASARLLPVCAERGVATLAAQTFGWMGNVSFVRFPNTWRLCNMTRSFTGQSAAQAHLRWVRGQANIDGVLVSMQDTAQVKENAAAVQAAMPRADMASVFGSFAEAIRDTDDGWQALLEDPEWEARMAAEAYLAAHAGKGA